MRRLKSQHEKGQSAVIVALLLIAMMGMLALTFDGANGYFQRRLAQTAADAGALAGARELCMGGSADEARAVANDYATVHNRAQSSDTVVATGMVTVTTAITVPTTFGNILGVPEVTVGAQAAAGCFVPSGGRGVLPIAWPCKHPDVDLNPDNETQDSCAIKYANPDENSYPLYVIMDSENSARDYECAPNGTLNCDLNGDGYDDIFGTGGRGWLDLNGPQGGANELSCWILSGANCQLDLPIHSWRSEQDGVSNSIFFDAGSIAGTNHVLPVFDYLCRPIDGVTCPTPWHADVDNSPGGGGNSAYWYHIISFSIFHITCVRTNGNAHTYDPENTGCPGYNAVYNRLPASKRNALRTIEGYFVEGYDPSLYGSQGGGGYFTGAFTLFLTR